MIRRLSVLLAAGFAALLIGGAAIAQTSNYLPIPSNVCLAAGGLLVAQDQNNATCIAAVASGQVLSSAGTGTKPAWTASPSLTGATIGASGTALTQIRVYSQTVTPSQITAAKCAEQSVTVTGVTTADIITVNPPAITTSAAPVAVRVSAANTLAVTFCNPSSVSVNPNAGTYTFLGIRS